MSLGRRSERSKKRVNYSRFCTEEGDDGLSTNSDDDFQDSPGPPNKKCKVSKPMSKPKQQENKMKMSSKSKEPPKKKERLCLEDKIYKRELEAALEASRRESSQDDSKSVDEEDIDSEQDDIDPRLIQDRAKLTSTSEDNDKENDSVFEENKPRKLKSSQVDELKSDTGNVEGKSKNNTAWKEESEDDLQGPKTEDYTVEEAQTGNCSDLYLEKNDSDNESFGEDEDEESDFEELGKKPRKTQSCVQPPATSTRPSIKPRTSVTAKNSPSVKNSLSVSSIPSLPLKFSSASTPRSSLGTGLGGVNIRTSGPPIRLGLSRNVRVKPLHPNV